jgi:capsular polysaccharide transport system permease protein
MLKSRWNVVSALILRDMRTRFGRSHLGYILVVAWPLVHLGAIVIIMTSANRVVPLGNEPAVFISTGVLPYVLCLYPARMMGFSIEHGRSLFMFPVVRVFDVLVARAIVEILTSFLVVLIYMSVMTLLGIDIVPARPDIWAASVICIIYFAISLGYLNMILYSISKMWQVFFILLMIVSYMTSGVFVLPSSYSEEMRAILWFNPLLHFVEWLRSSYYEGYGDDMLSRSYVFFSASVNLLIGLAGERFLRGKLLAA